jgi:cell division protein FtsW (lipid II flippase)
MPEASLPSSSPEVGGTVLMVIVSRVDYHRWRDYAWPLLLATVVLLLIPLLPLYPLD